MNVRRFTFSALLALAGLGGLVALRAGGQDPNKVETRYESEEIVRQLPDGRVERVTVQVPVAEPQPKAGRSSTIVEQREDGVFVERTVDGKVLRMQKGGPGFPGGSPFASLNNFQFSPQPVDAESQKLLADEQALAQEVRKLSNNLISIEMPEEKQAEQKKAIREKLAAIFDLQQQRRTREIAKIEERLGKLKDVLKKRETAKDSIVDRRLESITGGVDELGWEESFGPATSPVGPRFAPPVQPRAASSASVPLTVPGPNAVIPPAAGPSLPPPTAPVAPTAPVPPAPSVDESEPTIRSRY